jgi:hypothetical protein
MPPLARWYIKLAMLYLVGALVVGVLQGLRVPILSVAAPAYVHMLVVGWITQMIFGVAYWMFPKFAPANPRGSNVLGIATFLLLNLGLLLRVVVEPVRTWRPGALPGELLVVAAVAQALAGVGFLLITWPRVKEK